MFGLDDIIDPKVEDNVFIPEPKLKPEPETKKVYSTQYKDYTPEYNRFKNGAKDTFYSNYERYKEDGKDEHGSKFRARVEYFFNRDNGLPVSSSSKYKTAYKNYLKNKTLI